jgi:CubicO group peptidase (beta-lactamase class C family)
MTHTSGLTYDFWLNHPVDEMYRKAGFGTPATSGFTLEEACDRWAPIPLLFEPGTAWNYSVSTDVLGRVVEVASGQSLDEFFAKRIFEPLGMRDTSFGIPPGSRSRLTRLYAPDPQTGLALAWRSRRRTWSDSGWKRPGCSQAVAVCSRLPRTTCPSRICCWVEARLMECVCWRPRPSI